MPRPRLYSDEERKERKRAQTREAMRRYREKHPERSKASLTRYRAANPEKCRQTTKDWIERNRDRYLEISRAARRRRRARLRGAAGNATAVQIQSRVAFYGGKCYMCGAPWQEIDHVIPLVAGGSHWPSNLRPSCMPCNRAKGGKSL